MNPGDSWQKCEVSNIETAMNKRKDQDERSKEGRRLRQECLGPKNRGLKNCVRAKIRAAGARHAIKICRAKLTRRLQQVSLKECYNLCLSWKFCQTPNAKKMRNSPPAEIVDQTALSILWDVDISDIKFEHYVSSQSRLSTPPRLGWWCDASSQKSEAALAKVGSRLGRLMVTSILIHTHALLHTCRDSRFS